MIFRDFLKDLEGQKLCHVATPAGVHMLFGGDSIMGAKCTLIRVEEDFIVLQFVKTSIFTTSKTVYIPIARVYCEFPVEKE